MEPFADRIALPRNGRLQVAAEWAGRYAERLAAYARRFPLQWYNFFDFWTGDPALPAPKPLNTLHETKPDARHSNTLA
jgi:predicted LPLAT superfamily acyltransferase